MTKGEPAVQLTAVQIRMARAGAGLTIRQLAELTGLNKATIVRIEAGMSAHKSSFSAIQKALEANGAEFHLLGDYADKVAVSFNETET